MILRQTAIIELLASSLASYILIRFLPSVGTLIAVTMRKHNPTKSGYQI